MIIRLKVFEQTLSIVDTKSVPRKGSKDYLILQFMFSSDWKDLNKLCYLQKGEVSQPIDVVNNIVKVPEWFTQQDHFYITLFGKNDSQEVPTNVVPLRLDKSNTLWEKDAPEPQPSWIVKLIDLNNHPPVPGNNGYWMIWDTDKGAYVESELPQNSVQPDWNQNDSTKPDYVKNRPFYTNDYLEMPMEETTVEFTKNGSIYSSTGSYSFYDMEFGKTYQVTWDGTTYECICYEHERELVFGNLSILGLGEDTGEPFVFGFGSFYTRDNSASHTISIWRILEVNVKIEEKYIPELQYMDKVNPTGTGSFSLNRKIDTIVGDYSFTEGNNTTASDWCSHAEGDSTTASGNCSHAEGNNTTTSAWGSHAEGSGTKASSDNQHVQGKYNIEDTANTYAHIVGNGTSDARSNAHTLDWSGNAWFAGTIEGKAFILPSSTEGSTKRFKITVDDDYNVSATNTSDSVSKTLATTEYVDSSVSKSNPLNITGATVGQIAKITAVDDSGKPTAWEAEDLPNNEKFIVTFSGNDGSYVCDKTMNEIVNAYENGQDISAYFTGSVESPVGSLNVSILLSLTMYDPGMYIEFASDVYIYGLYSIVAFIDDTGLCGVSYNTALDNSLTDNNYAADAKAVGDALARKQDTLIQSGATVGQIAKITAVDDSGKPTAWEAVNMPSGGGAPFSFDLIADHTVTAEDLSVSRLTWTNETIQDLGKYNLFYAVIESDTEFGIKKWVKFYINNSPVSLFAGSSSPKCKIIPATCNRFFGKWIGTSVYNPVNSVPFPVLVGPCESAYQEADALKSAEDARSIAIGSYAADFGLAEGMRIKVYAMI